MKVLISCLSRFVSSHACFLEGLHQAQRITRFKPKQLESNSDNIILANSMQAYAAKLQAA